MYRRGYREQTPIRDVDTDLWPGTGAAWFATRTVGRVAWGEGRLTTVSDGYLALTPSFVVGGLDAAVVTRLIEGADYSLGDFQSP